MYYEASNIALRPKTAILPKIAKTGGKITVWITKMSVKKLLINLESYMLYHFKASYVLNSLITWTIAQLISNRYSNTCIKAKLFTQQVKHICQSQKYIHWVNVWLFLKSITSAYSSYTMHRFTTCPKEYKTRAFQYKYLLKWLPNITNKMSMIWLII